MLPTLKANFFDRQKAFFPLIDGLKVNVTFRCYQINKNKYVNKNLQKRDQEGFDEIFHFKQLVELI